jgi:Fe-S cluster biogenesis protein NfuA
MHEEVNDAIRPLREMLQLDGADIAVESYDDGVLRLQLELEGASCRECVLPKPMLERTYASVLSDELDGFVRVVIDDPRESEALPEASER